MQTKSLVKKPKSRAPTVITALIIIAIYLLVFVLEQFVDSALLFIVLKKGAVYALVAVSMNLLNGFTGLFSLGQAGFMLIGAYTYAIFTIPLEARKSVYQYFDGGIVQADLFFWVALLLAGLAAAIFAFLIGLPVLRLRSDYLAIATLGFAEIMRAIFQWNYLGPVTNGSNVLRLYPTLDNFKLKLPGGDTLNLSTTLAFVVAGVCIALIILLVHSTYGRAFKAIRDDEVAAQAMGINLARHKMLSFVISSFFAGVGGGLFAMFTNTVKAGTFMSAMTYEILLIVVIGGIGSITGSIISAFLFVGSSEWWLRFLDSEMYLQPDAKLRFVVVAILILLAISALSFFRSRKKSPKKRRQNLIITLVADVALVGWLLWFQFFGSDKMPFLRNGFRTVVFAVVIMAVVLFFSRGLMGDKELPDLLRKIGHGCKALYRKLRSKPTQADSAKGGSSDV